MKMEQCYQTPAHKIQTPRNPHHNNEQVQVHVSPPANYPPPPISVSDSYDITTSTAPIFIRKMPVMRNGDLYGEFKFQ